MKVQLARNDTSQRGIFENVAWAALGTAGVVLVACMAHLGITEAESVRQAVAPIMSGTGIGAIAIWCLNHLS